MMKENIIWKKENYKNIDINREKSSEFILGHLQVQVRSYSHNFRQI